MIVRYEVKFAEIDPQEMQNSHEKCGGEIWAECSLGSRARSSIVTV
jgi:hypothetical protein